MSENNNNQPDNDNTEQNSAEMPNRDRRIAITAQSLFLANISFLPILAFFMLLPIYNSAKHNLHPRAIEHCRQSILGCIASGILLVIVSGTIVLLGGLEEAYTWVFLITYFISIHSALILYGVFALIKAIVGEPYRYPLIGRFWQVN